MTHDLKTQGEWKTRITMEINFFFFKDSIERRTLHTKFDNIEIMDSNETDEINETFLQKYQKG